MNKLLEVELNLLARGTSFVVEDRCAVAVQQTIGNDQLAWLELPQATKRGLVGWLDEALRRPSVNCHGESGLAIAANANELSVVVGMPVYPGQRMLPSSRRLSIRGLEQSSVVGLAEVTSVGPRRATLTMYAGPGHRDIADMIAVPMAAFAP